MSVKQLNRVAHWRAIVPLALGLAAVGPMSRVFTADAASAPFRLVRAPIVYVEPNGDGGYALDGYVRLNRRAPRHGHGAELGIEVVGAQTRLPSRVTDANSTGAQTLAGSHACYGIQYATLPADIGAGRAGEKVKVGVYIRGMQRPLRATVRIKRRSRRGLAPSQDTGQVALGCVGR